MRWRGGERRVTAPPLAFPIGSRFYDWRYVSEPERHMGGRRIAHARGKALGGSSSTNGMIFQRGSPLDYERWAAAPGMQAWDYAHCLPYFRRMERCLAAAPGDPFHGLGGPLVVERGPATTPFTMRSSTRSSRPAIRSPMTSTAPARRGSPRSTATSPTAGGSRRPAPTCTLCVAGPTSTS